MSRNARIVVAVVLVVIGAVAARNAWRDAQAWSLAGTACKADASAADVRDAVDDIPVDHVAVREAAECACVADAREGKRPECYALLLRVLADPANADWTPAPELASALLDNEIATGNTAAVRGLAERVLQQGLSRDPAIVSRAVEVLLVEGEDSDRVAALAAAAAANDLDVGLAAAAVFMHRGLAAGTERLLGATAPTSAELRARWFVLRAQARAATGDANGAEDILDAWVAAGEDPGVVMGQRIFVLETQKLPSPRGIELPDAYEQAIAAAEKQGNTPLLMFLYTRYVMTLASRGQADAAISAYERSVKAGVPSPSLSAELLRRSAAMTLAAKASKSTPTGSETRAFILSLKGAPPGATLWVSHADDPVDAPFRRVTPGTEFPAIAPVRYVVRSSEGALLTSGRVWPVDINSDRRTAETIDVTKTTTTLTSTPSQRTKPGDGRRRLFTIVLDCGDWRVARGLLERGELPTLRSLIDSGTSGVLLSQPAYTAEALESIVHPSSARRISVLATFTKMGDELAGLAAVGKNPWVGLNQVLPERPNFFSTVGAGDKSAVNLLFTIGGQVADGPRNGDVTGPRGARSERPLGNLERALRPDELARHPALADERLMAPIAAEFDLLDDEASGGKIDVVLIRIEALDLITHKRFVQTFDQTISDADLVLHSAYRYIDDRLGKVNAELDGDDFLIVMSDHGIATGLKHDYRALWIANGPGVPKAHLEGTPNLRGVPAQLAHLVGVETDWPKSALAP